MARSSSAPKDVDRERSEFTESMGQMLASFGLPPMASRIFAALLVSSPAEQSASDLAERLHASRGSISTMTRMLEAPGLIERVRKRGDRKTYYRVTPDGWYRAMQREADSMGAIRALAEIGERLMRSEPPGARRGIEDTVTFLRFWEREIGHVLSRWREHKAAQSTEESA